MILQGTWQFLSTRLCRFGRKKHQLQDDLESFVHVVMYTTLRYMRNKYTQAQLQQGMKSLYDESSNQKPAMFLDGLDQHMGSELVLPDAPPLVRWIAMACDLVKEWLSSTYSKVSIDTRTQATILLASGPVPDTIRFHDHTALLELWKSTLDSEDWNKVTPQPAHDNLAKSAEQREPKGLQLPPSESPATVQSDKTSVDNPSPTTSKKRGLQRHPESRSKRLRQD